MVSTEVFAELLGVVEKLTISVGITFILTIIILVILVVHIAETTLSGHGIKRIEGEKMTEKERRSAAREAWRKGDLDELRWLFGEMDKDLDEIMDTTFQEVLCAGKNFD